MSTAQLILFFFGGMGILNSVFFAVYLFFHKRGNLVANKILSFLLLAFAIRVAKSIFYYVLNGVDIAFINAGLIGKAAIGPLLFLYVLAATRPNFRWKTEYWLHFIPSAVLLALTPFMEWSIITLSYRLTMGQMLLYMILSFVQVERYMHRTENNVQLKAWLQYLLYGVSFVWLAYLSQILMGGITIYAIGATWFVLVMYIALYLAMRQHKVFSFKTKETKYQTSHLSSFDLNQYEAPLLKLMTENEVFTDQALSLSSLASEIGIRPDVLSRLVNERFERNFNDFVNGYRIKKAQEMLSDPITAQEKIATIAFECGFKSVSSFNTAFKKLTGTTPSSYRDQFNRSVGYA